MTVASRRRICIFLTLFEKGGVTSYWEQIIASSPDIQWDIFTNSNSLVGSVFNHAGVNWHAGIKWFDPEKTNQAFSEYLKNYKPDSVYFNGTLAEILVFKTIITSKISRRKIKFNSIFHNRDIYRSRLKSALNRIIISFLGFFHTKNIFVGKSVARYWYCPGRTIPIPINRKPRALTVKSSYTIGFLGRLSWEKGPDLFFEVIERLRALCSNSQLNFEVLVAGDGPLLEELKNKSPNATFLGWVEDPHTCLACIDLLLLTSRTEGYPLNIGESLGQGTPVIAFDVGGVRDILTGDMSQYVIDSGNIKKMSQLAKNFLDDYHKNYSRYFSNAEVGEKSDVNAKWIREILD